MVVAKELGHPFELLSIGRKGQPDFGDVLSGTQRALLGHCRAKTIGDTTRRNAHPFMFDTLMGTHNGTLDFQTRQTLVGKDKFGTDSEALFYEIKTFGLQETLKKLHRPGKYMCKDAYALVWYNLENNTLNFLRNQERPLYYCFDKEKKLLFWSSEFGHLLAVTNDTIKHEDAYIYEVQKDLHYSWVIPPQGQAFGKAHVVKSEAGIDPLAVATSSGSILGGYRVSTGRMDTTYEDTYQPGDYVQDPWHDPFTGFWQRFNRAAYLTQWANQKLGPWYNSKQQAWDALAESAQELRIKEGKYPSDINIRKKLGNGLAPSCDLRDRPELNDSLEGLNNVTVEKRDTLTVAERMKKEAMEKWFKECNHDMTDLLPVTDLQGCKVYFNRTTSKYVTFTFKGWQTKPKSESWVRIEYEICPKFVPFTEHDIQARHFYKHEGKKKKKVTYFRGFNGDMLVKTSFEKIMEDGCLNCGRSPKWGNYVRFVDHKFFFCEFCERHTELVNGFKTGTKN
jgi:hypothetical protein